MKDEFGREIRYLRVAVTDRCNLRCMYCMPEDGIEKKSHQDILKLEDIYKIIEASTEIGFNKIRITGGEPLLRKNILWLIEKVALLNEIKDLSMTTNGILLGDYAKDLKNSGLDRVNISLDTLDDKKYELITRGGRLSKVLDGMEKAVKHGLNPLKINVVLMKDFNTDEIEKISNLTVNEDIHIRFIELMPIGEASGWGKDKYISNQIVLEKLNNLIELENEAGSPARRFKINGAKGTIGLINAVSMHFCSTCNRIRLTAEGKIKPCLHWDKEIDVMKSLGSKKEIIKRIEEAINCKPEKHNINLENYKPVKKNMNSIGG